MVKSGMFWLFARRFLENMVPLKKTEMTSLSEPFCAIIARRVFLIGLSFSFEKLHPPDATVSGSVRKILESRPTLWPRCRTLAGFEDVPVLFRCLANPKITTKLPSHMGVTFCLLFTCLRILDVLGYVFIIIYLYCKCNDLIV